MNKKEMNVHSALAELKVLDKRIVQAIGNGDYVAAHKKSNTVVSGMTLKEYTDSTISGYASITDLIRYRDALKRAVVKSNAITEVEIGGEKYTVAEAIWMNSNGLRQYRELRDAILYEYTEAKRMCDAANRELEDRAIRHAEALFGDSDDKNKDTKVQEFIEEMIAKGSYELLTGLDIPKILDDLQAKIDTFTAEVDSALSVSNALTTFVVEW